VENTAGDEVDQGDEQASAGEAQGDEQGSALRAEGLAIP